MICDDLDPYIPAVLKLTRVRSLLSLAGGRVRSQVRAARRCLPRSPCVDLLAACKRACRSNSSARSCFRVRVLCSACEHACAPACRRSLCAASGAWRRSACQASAGGCVPLTHWAAAARRARALHGVRPRLASAVAHAAQLLLLRRLTKRGGAPSSTSLPSGATSRAETTAPTERGRRSV